MLWMNKMCKKQCLVSLAVISAFFLIGSFAFAEVPDKLRVEGPVPNQVPVGTTKNIRATVLKGFIGVEGAEVVFTKQSGSFNFNTGDISSDGTRSVMITDSSGVAVMNIFAGCEDPCADCTGPCLIEITVTGTGLSAFSVFDAVESISSNMVKGPYLIYNGNNTEMDVLWQFDSTQCSSDGSIIEWGLDTNYDLGSAATIEYGSDHQHKYTITSLTPGTRYYYRVKEANSVTHTGDFLAAPLEWADQVKFLAYGDTRTIPAYHDNVCAAIVDAYTADPDYQTFLLHVGDWTEEDDELGWTREFFGPTNAQTLMSQIPINGCRGNHENGDNAVNYAKYWPYPYVDDYYWSFDYGPAHIAVVDQYVMYGLGSAQYTWLENDLAASNAEWKFLLFHEPAWSGAPRSGEIVAQNTFQPLCLAYGVDIVFAGHNHHYARASIDGVQHITTGGGGAPLGEIELSYPELVAAEMALHFCEIDIQGNTLYFTARKIDGSIIDFFSLEHSSRDDGIYDLKDFAKLATNWMETGCIVPNWCEKTDLDQDGQVTMDDLLIMAQGWLRDYTLIAHWKFDGDATDSTGDGNHGTAVGTPVYDPAGHIDGSVVFNGTTDYFELQGFPCVTGTRSRTVEGWIKTTAGGEIMGWGSPSTGAKWHMSILDGPGVAGALQVDVWSGHIVGSTDLRDGAWHHIAAVLQNDSSPNVDEIKLYVDGKEEDYSDVLSMPINTGTEDLSRIGVYVAGSGGLYYFFEGQMDDMRLYERALSDEQIADRGGWDGLLAHWPLDSDATDASGDDHDGTAMGGLTYTGTGKVGGAAVFDGSDDYIEIIGYNGVTGDHSRTIAAWIKTSASGPMEIAYWGQAGSGVRWKFQLIDGIGAAGAVQLDVSGGYVIGSTDVRDGLWHHVAAVLEDDGTPNADEIKLYVDGNLETISASASMPVQTGGGVNMMIGGILGTTVVYNFDGQIDDVRLYGIALSQARIAELANP